jgi:hypothetical protein
MKVFLIKSSQPNGHYCAQRHFSFAGDVVAEDALTDEQWAEVHNDAWLSVVDGEADAETAGVLADELAKAKEAQAEAEKLAASEAAAQKAKGKTK